MKKIFLTIAALVFLCTACTKDSAKLLDPASTAGLSDAFGKYDKADQFLLNIYRQIVEVIPHADNEGTRWPGTVVLLDIGDENETGNGTTGGPQHDFNTGATTALSTNSFSYYDWNTYYGAIRMCLLYLNNIGSTPADASNFTEPTRKLRIAEAKWLEAFFYAELCKEFGGLPLVKTVYDPTADLALPRSTYDETVNYIVGLCDEAAAGLQDAYGTSGSSNPNGVQAATDFGRATKGAALALKARVLLYAASPLWNDGANPTDTYLSGKYDATKWQKAAQAAQDVIALNQYALVNDISTLFTTRYNTEIIYARMQQPTAYFTATAVPYRLFAGSPYALGGYNQATYNAMKQYEVLKNGVAYNMTDPASGWNAQDPFKNLDPRFYRDIIYNGAHVEGKTAEFGEVPTGVSKAPAHNMTTTLPQYQSYMYAVKFCDLTLPITTSDPKSTGGGQALTNQNYMYFRYAEILMNYAEAVNEAYGPDVVPPISGATMSAREALNKVRTRAAYVAGKAEYMGYTGSMPPVAGGLSKDAFRDVMKHERRVEFAFEEHYFWDIRRWKQVPETTVQALIPVWTSPTTVTYQLRSIDTRFFDTQKSYRMPIPNADILGDPLMKQNPGY